jgi:hypothetical protein
MRTPYSSDELEKLRTVPQGTKWFVAHHQPRTHVNLSLASVPQTHPVSAIEFVGGSINFQSDWTLWLGNDNGSNLGKVRLRGLPETNGNGASILPIAESGSGLINWNEVTTISVKDEFRPWVRHPRYDTAGSQWRMDYFRAWPGSLCPPYVNMGAPVVGFLENGSFTASFFNTEHARIDTASLISKIWEFPNGSIVQSSDDEFAVTFTGASPNGSYIKCTILDFAGQSAVGYRLVFVYNDESEVPEVNIGEVQGGIQSGGYRVQMEVLENGQDIQDEAEIVVFSKNIYGDSASKFGGNYPNRGNVLFRGWANRESIVRQPFMSKALIEATTIDGVLRESNSYDYFVARSNPVSPASHWVHEAVLSLDRVAWRLLTERSTVAKIADFYPMSGIGNTDGLILFQDLPKSSLWEQLTQNYGNKGVLGKIAVDYQGGIHAFQDAQIAGTSANLPEIISFEDSDLMDEVIYEKLPRDTNAYVRLEAVSGDTPLGAESPGNVQGYYGGEFQVTRGLTTQNQGQLITWAGNMRAKINNDLPKVSLKTTGAYNIDPVPQSIVRLSLAASQNVRGYEINNEQFLPNALRMEYDSSKQFQANTIEMERVVNGIGGSAITFPKVADIIPIPTPIPPPPSDPPGETGGTGFGTVYVMTQDTLGRTRQFSASSPSWIDVSPGGTTYHDFILDPWAPSTNGYLATIDGIYKSTSLDLDTPIWEVVLSKAEIESALGLSDFRYPNKIVGSINIQDWIGFWFMIGTSQNPNFKFAYTTDGGDTWSYSSVNSPSEFPGIENADTFGGSADVVPHLVNGALVLYAGCPRGGSSTSRDFYVYKSTDSGLTWAETGDRLDGGRDIGWTMHCPYFDNEDGNRVYTLAATDTVRQGFSYSLDGGDNFISVPPGQVDANSVQIHRWGGETYTQSEQSYYWYDDGTDTILYVADTPGGTYSAKQMNGISGQIYSSGGFPYNNSQFYAVCENGIFVSTDGGDNWVDKTGDWAYGFTSTYDLKKPTGGTVQAHAYVIVPDWTE